MSTTYKINYNPHNPVSVVKAGIVREIIAASGTIAKLCNYEFVHRTIYATDITVNTDKELYVDHHDFIEKISSGALFGKPDYIEADMLPEYGSWTTILNLTNNYSLFATMDTPSIAAVMRINNELISLLDVGKIQSFPMEQTMEEYVSKSNNRGSDEVIGHYLTRMSKLYPTVKRFMDRVMKDISLRMTHRYYHTGSTTLSDAQGGYSIVTVNISSAVAYVVARGLLNSNKACVLYEDVGNKRLWRVASRVTDVNVAEVLRKCIGKHKCSEIFSENGFICMWSDNTNLVATRSDYNLIAG